MTTDANTYPLLFDMDTDEEEECQELVAEKLDDLYKETKQYVDDAVSGFWKAPPRERRALYDNAGPVFADGIMPLALELMLETGELGPLVPVYETVQQPTVDPMSGQAVMLPVQVQIGEAPAVLAPYWQRLYAVDREEAIKCIRDYARMLAADERVEVEPDAAL